MKRTLTLLGLTLIGLATSCSSPKARTSPAALELFNGRDLAGWQATLAKPDVKMEEVWSVRDGVIVCKGEPMGYLYTTQSFTNFQLQVEYRWAPGQVATNSNSGIFSRINGEPRPLPRCIETQLKHGSAGDFYGFHGLRISGPAARFKHIPDHKIGGDLYGVSRARGSEQPDGQWNQVLILVNGPKIIAYFNGEKVNEATGLEVVGGPIGLQSEGGEVHFRSVRITPLP